MTDADVAEASAIEAKEGRPVEAIEETEGD